MSDLNTLVGRALTDDKFVEELMADPEGTLRAAGIEPTAEILDALEDVDVEMVKNLAAAFGSDRAA
jgi:hypothetical protein